MTWKTGILGGTVIPFKSISQKQFKSLQKRGDTVRTILQAGELVIPLRYVPTVSHFLRRKRITFGNFK